MVAKKKSEWFDWVKALLIAFGLVFVVRTFFFAPIVVDGPSMMPTLHNGDQMIVNKIVYDIHEPDRFDIVVFHASDKKDFIKRVVGLPGEHVAEKNDVLYINGEKVNESFLDEQKSENGLYTGDFQLEEITNGTEKIPEGKVLVLGDNRNNSTDSRILGLISMDEIVGKASLIYWPFDRIEILHD